MDYWPSDKRSSSRVCGRRRSLSLCGTTRVEAFMAMPRSGTLVTVLRWSAHFGFTRHPLSHSSPNGRRTYFPDARGKRETYSQPRRAEACRAVQPYEFGVKTSLATTAHGGFVLGAMACPGNPYDGHTLEEQLEQVERLTGKMPKRCHVDRGYKGHGVDPDACKVLIAGSRKGISRALRKEMKRRSAIEPEIGHQKSDGKLGRNWLKGMQGDAINAVLCGMGHNLRKILTHLRRLFVLIWAQLLLVLKPRDGGHSAAGPAHAA